MLTNWPRGFIGLLWDGGSLSQIHRKSWDSDFVTGGWGLRRVPGPAVPTRINPKPPDLKKAAGGIVTHSLSFPQARP